MSTSQPTDRIQHLNEIFVTVTGDEKVTESQEERVERELRGENRLDEALEDGLDDAIAGAQADSGDPGDVGTPGE